MTNLRFGLIGTGTFQAAHQGVVAKEIDIAGIRPLKHEESLFDFPFEAQGADLTGTPATNDKLILVKGTTVRSVKLLLTSENLLLILDIKDQATAVSIEGPWVACLWMNLDISRIELPGLVKVGNQ